MIIFMSDSPRYHINILKLIPKTGILVIVWKINIIQNVVFVKAIKHNIR